MNLSIHLKQIIIKIILFFQRASHCNVENIMVKQVTFEIPTPTSLKYKHHVFFDIKYLIVVLVLTTNTIIHPVRGGNIICSKSEYVTSGIEFKKCQDETLQSFQPENRQARGKYKKAKCRYYLLHLSYNIKI